MEKETNFTEKLFNQLKKSGLFGAYKDYASYSQNKKISELEKSIQAEVMEEEKPKPLKEKYEDTLNEKDRKEFVELFGGEQSGG